jgi:L-iditol 2-dehydrogenase
MKLARYIGNGEIAIQEEQKPNCPTGGLLVQTEASGLCSGELMQWYMDKKIPHVLGHEVSGVVIESQSDRFPVGSRVFPHHHAPCGNCDYCLTGRFVHCATWRATKLHPGGMAEFFAVPPENLSDTLRTDTLRPVDAALIEPMACVMKSIRLAGVGARNAVVGLGVMGLMHLFALKAKNAEAEGFDLNESRVTWALDQGLNAKSPSTEELFDVIFVCPGSQRAFDFALSIADAGATICMFAPLPPGEMLQVPQLAYFKDLRIVNAYSCGPNDTLAAKYLIEAGNLRAEHVVSEFIGLDKLPDAYQRMKNGTILKPMVKF